VVGGDGSACPTCPCLHPEPTPPNKWAALSAIVNALNDLQAPYNIHAGTLLGLVRGCNIFDGNIDLVIDGWWLDANHQEAELAFTAAGFTSDNGHFGTLGHEGYEESQFHEGLSLLTSRVMRATSLIHASGIKVDFFTVQRFFDKYVWGLWLDGGVDYHPCTTRSTGVAVYNWLGLNVSIPVPIEDALTSLYGSDYMTPRSWTWNVEPFTVGSCT